MSDEPTTAAPEPIMAPLLIDLLRQQVAEAKAEIASLLKDRLEQQRVIESDEQQVATLTEALEKIGNASYTELRPIVERYRLDPKDDVYRSYATDEEWTMARNVSGWFQKVAEAALAAVREPIEYERCTCDHPGDTPSCVIDHDQIQHEQLTIEDAILLAPRQEDLPDDAAKALRDNLWNLYGGDQIQHERET